MNNAEASELLMSGAKGVSRWNQLRSSRQINAMDIMFDLNPYFDSPLDLRGADLGGCCLIGSNLSEADFTGAHLYQTNLENVNLSRTNFTGAHLVEANLSGTSIDGASFERADLRQVKMCNAEGAARFSHAQMDRIDMFAGIFDGSDFSSATLVDARLEQISAMGAHFIATNLLRANLKNATLNSPESMPNSAKTRFDMADLSQADLSFSKMSFVNLRGANLSRATLNNTSLNYANLEEVRMIGTELKGATITGSSIYGISAWDLGIDENTKQGDLIISKLGEAAISVDDLEVAQFMYMLMHNVGLRRVIDTITSKVVLVLGRFSEARKPTLDAIRLALKSQQFDLVPIVFDFDKPASRTTAETVSTLAGMARFVIADLSDAKSVLQELGTLVPSMPSLPIQSVILDSQQEPGMLDFLKRYPWFLEVQSYADDEDLIARLAQVIAPAMNMSKQIRDNG